MANKNRTVFYTGVAGDLQKRVFQHKEKVVPGFTSRYNADELVYYEEFLDAYNAITREKQIKGGSRKDKHNLITGFNPELRDLSGEL